MTLSAGAHLGPYEILALLGAGGMGEVYRARDVRLGRTVAIKVLPQALLEHAGRRQRFEREARTASKLSHPHICTLYDVGAHHDMHFIVMEHLDGETLAARLRRGPPPLGQALQYAVEIADALSHAHRAGIVHRDLKPSNVMLTSAGAKLLDFGVATFAATNPGDPEAPLQAAETEPLTDVGSVPGTLQYMAPEQIEGDHADARTDIFAFGVLVYEMATGRRPFGARTKAGVIAAILKHDPPPLSSVVRSEDTREPVPPSLDRVVSRCLAKEPDDRWQTAADLREELRWIVAGGADSARVATRAPRLRRSVLAWALAACLAIVAAAYLGARSSWMSTPTTEPTFKQLTFRRGTITDARFTSDNQTVVYSAAWDGGAMRLYRTSSAGPESSALGPLSTGLASVSSNNELAVLLGCRLEYGFCVGTLARMPLSGGAPRELLDNVESADWRPNSQQLAVIHQASGEYRVEFPIGKVLHTTIGRLHGLRFSPGGTQLAFMEYPTLEGEVGVLKVLDLEGHVTTLSSGWRSIRGLHWSPSGDEVWFTGSRSGKSCSVYAVSLSGALRLIFHAPGDVTLTDVAPGGRLLLTYGSVRARMVWSKEGHDRDLSWFDWPRVADLSTDGRTVLFYESGEGASARPSVYTRPVDGADAVRLGEGKALALSPDGHWALALSEGTPPKLLLHPMRTGEPRVLDLNDLKDVYWARWFPDSTRILLVGWREEGVRTFIQNVVDGHLQPVGDLGTMGLLVHPDGQRILTRDALGHHHLWPLGDRPPVPVTGLQADDNPLQWDVDARFLYVKSGDEAALRVFRYSLGSGRRELWRTLAPSDPAGLIGVGSGRDEVAMTRDGKSTVFTYWAWLGDLFLVEGAR